MTVKAIISRTIYFVTEKLSASATFQNLIFFLVYAILGFSHKGKNAHRTPTNFP